MLYLLQTSTYTNCTEISLKWQPEYHLGMTYTFFGILMSNWLQITLKTIPMFVWPQSLKTPAKKSSMKNFQGHRNSNFWALCVYQKKRCDPRKLKSQRRSWLQILFPVGGSATFIPIFAMPILAV